MEFKAESLSERRPPPQPQPESKGVAGKGGCLARWDKGDADETVRGCGVGGRGVLPG